MAPIHPYDAEIPLPRLRSITQLWACAAVLASVGVAALAVDVPLARWIASGHCPAVLQKLAGLGEIFGHGLGVVLIGVVIWVLDPWHRYALPRILTTALGAGLTANVLKLLVARWRPHHFDLNGRGLESFADWLPLAGNSSWQQSFPSSHAATAAALAVVLACFYPRGRWMFPVFAAVAGFQRIAAGSHFLSDVFWGAAVGCIFAPLCVYGSRLSRLFDRLEQRLLARVRSVAGPRATRMPENTTTPAADLPHAA